jgi:hypothetical protein
VHVNQTCEEQNRLEITCTSRVTWHEDHRHLELGWDFGLPHGPMSRLLLLIFYSDTFFVCFFCAGYSLPKIPSNTEEGRAPTPTQNDIVWQWDPTSTYLILVLFLLWRFQISFSSSNSLLGMGMGIWEFGSFWNLGTFLGLGNPGTREPILPSSGSVLNSYFHICTSACGSSFPGSHIISASKGQLLVK